MLLHQSSNDEQAIPIQVSSRIRLPRRDSPVEVKCHAFGYRDEAGRNWIRLEAIHIKRAGLTATPRRLVALNALRPHSALKAADYSPFITLERLKEEVRDSLKLDAQIVDSLLADAGKRTAMSDGFQNKVILSGFIGHKAYIQPADDGSGDLGHIMFHLLQRADVDKALVIRVQGADSRFGRELKSLHPVAVIGQVRTQVEKDEEGAVITRKIYFTTDRNNVGSATAAEFAEKKFPAWWNNAVNAHYNQRRELVERSRPQPTPAETTVATPPAVQQLPMEPLEVPPAPVAAGVEVSDEVF